MFETKCGGDNVEMLVTVLTVFVTNIFESKTINSSVEKLPGEVDFFSIESSFSHSPSELLLDTVDTVGSGVDVES